MHKIFFTTTTVKQALKIGIPEIDSGEYDTEEDVLLMQEIASSYNIDLINVGSLFSLMEGIKKYQPSEIWNLNSGLFGRMREAHAPAMIESSGIVCRGADTWLCAMTQDKIVTSILMAGLTFQTIEILPTCSIIGFACLEKAAKICASSNLSDQMILKPRFEGSSRGLFVVDTANYFPIKQKLVRSVQKWGEYIAQPYIDGPDISMNFGLDSLGRLVNYRPLFTVSQGGVDTAEFKTYSLGYCPDKKIINTNKDPNQIIQDAWKIASFFQPELYLRIDLRSCKKTNRVFFLEVNATPTLSPHDDYIKSAEISGFNYRAVLSNIFEKLKTRKQHS